MPPRTLQEKQRRSAPKYRDGQYAVGGPLDCDIGKSDYDRYLERWLESPLLGADRLQWLRLIRSCDTRCMISTPADRLKSKTRRTNGHQSKIG